ncbi:MAG: DTW domain-containing protein [Planctomycetota bacterium]
MDLAVSDLNSAPEPRLRLDYTRAARCRRCKLPPGLCVCASIPRFELPYRFYVLRHATEVDKQSNTGSLVPEMLPGSRMFEWGSVQGPMDRSVLVDSQSLYFKLFPIPSAPCVSPELVLDSDGRVPTFVLCDASWSRARRMVTRIPELQRYPFVSLPATLNAQPARAMRRPPKPGHLSSLAAAIRVIELMGDVDVAREMRAFMEMLYERILVVRGKVRRTRACS